MLLFTSTGMAPTGQPDILRTSELRQNFKTENTRTSSPLIPQLEDMNEMSEEKRLLEAVDAAFSKKGYLIDTEEGHLNIIYIEDCFEGKFSDVRMLTRSNANGDLELIHKSTVKTAQVHFNGINYKPRIALGQHFNKWSVYFHEYSKYGTRHPALLQRKPIDVYSNPSIHGDREGPMSEKMYGLNQIGIPTFGNTMPGCIVSENWQDQLLFMEFLKTDPRYQKDKFYCFSCTILQKSDL